MNILSKILKFSILFVTCFLGACEKVIDIDLNTSNPQMVVEATLSDNPNQSAEVRLFRSVNFDESNNFPAIKNAVVVIQDKTTTVSDTLKQTSDGVYKGSKLKGVLGHIYFLSIQADGKTLTATSVIPRKVNLDSILVRPQSFFGNTSYQIIPKYTDPKGIGDFYRFIMTVNTTKTTNIFVRSDELSDGNINGRPLFAGGGGNNSNVEIKKGDTIMLEMHCIDEGVYDYFNTLSAANSGNSATPANPISNIKGGALGYFTAYTQQIRTVVVQ